MLDLEGPAPLPELGGEQLRLVRGQGGVIVGHDDGAAAHAGQVVIGVDLKTGDGEDGRLLFEAPGAAGEVGHGPVAGGLAVAGAADDGDLGQGGHGRDLASCCLQQQAGAALAGGVGVVVGIVGEGDEGGGLRDHARGDVGVQVERHDDWKVRPHDAAHGIENVAFRVLLGGGDHGAVHGEDEAVKGEGGAQVGEQGFLELGVAGIGENAAGDAARGQQGERLCTLLFTDGEDAGDFAVGAGQLEEGIALMDIGVAKEGQIGLRGGELVAFLEDRADADAHGCHWIAFSGPILRRAAHRTYAVGRVSDDTDGRVPTDGQGNYTYVIGEGQCWFKWGHESRLK